MLWGFLLSFHPKWIQLESEFRPRKILNFSPFSSRSSVQAHSGTVCILRWFSQRYLVAAEQHLSPEQLFFHSTNHILGYTKRPAITRNPAWRARSACQVPPTVTSLFTINERFTLHQSLPLPIPALAHIQARVVLLSSPRQLAFFFFFWFWVLFCFVFSHPMFYWNYVDGGR